jgi:prevent-host-death family protein
MAVVEPKTTVNIHAAKTHLSRLVERAEQGEETIIARNGRPVARLVPYQEERQPRVPGAWKGRVRMLPGFDEVDEEIARDFGMID